MRPARLSVFALAAAALLACMGSGPRFDEDAPLSKDGLRPLLNTRFEKAWARPGVDFSRYSRIWLVSEGVAYSDPPERAYGARTTAALVPFQREELEAAMLQAFRQAFFADGAWKLAEAPGPDVLLLRAGLVDVDVEAPPEPISVRQDVVIASAGRATLVLELLDSVTREVLARFADREDFDPSSGRMQNNVVNNRLEIRRTVEAWAGLARQRLEDLRALQLPAAAAQ
jgi:hypothetical protein